ncbi:MAG: PQQ-dependent sugar dehydrogenase [Hyphomonadaceae bacterium]|nr:PQQ-dependent sugar dehydrogenase [Hyphomonadaceae bacterium]
MTKAVRATLLAALALSAVACGGGGSSSPPPPPTSPPTSPPPAPPPPPPPPAGPAAPAFTSPAAITSRENVIGVIYRPVATDPNGDAITYGATIGGPDAARFAMNPVTREVRFAVAPDFETPTDAGGNNVYDISFTATDGTNTTTQNVAVTVANVANGFRVRRVASGLSAPIYVAGLPDGSGRVAVVLRGGVIRVLTPSTGAFETTNFLDISSQIDTNGEKGLLSIAFSPNFISDRTFYLHMNPTSTAPGFTGATEIRKYQVLANNYAQADAATADAILTVPQPSATNHKGGTVFFDKSGRLLISLGDGGSSSATAQNNSTLLGKILRIDPTADAFPADAGKDYSIPTANPFAAGGGLPEIYANGLRNPFRMSIDPVTGDLFIGDVGQGAIEEVDRISASTTALVNFGWDRREGSQAFNGGLNSSAFTLPVTEYGRSVGTTVTGGVVYRGPIEDLQAQYVFGDFGSNTLWSVPIVNLSIGSVLPSGSLTVRTTAFAPGGGMTVNSVVAFGTDIEGNVYLVDIGGELFVLEPNP